MKDWIKALEEATNRFWKEEYSKKDFNQKIDYWKNTLEKGFEDQKRMGLDEYSIFNKNWYQSVLEQEPDFDNIIQQLFEQYWKDLEYTKYLGAIDIEESNQ
jgi:hypothetical protein